MSAAYGPAAATQADAARASMRTAAVNADRTATAADREQAAEAEMAAYESLLARARRARLRRASARHGLIREHADRGQARSEPPKPSAGISSRRMTATAIEIRNQEQEPGQ